MEIVGETLLSAAVGLLFEKLASSELWRFAKKMWVHTDLKKWEKELLNIRQELNDAEEKQIADQSVKEWLSDLRDLAFDMEDVLDEFAYDALRQQLTAAASDQAGTSQVRKFISNFSVSEIRRRASVKTKAMEITRRLEQISARKSELGLEIMAAATAASAACQSSATTPMVYEPWIFGRDADKRMIAEMLLERFSETYVSVSVISIVAMGGVGKTTLAQLVYNDGETAKHFSPKAWVCVSNQYDAVRITKTILESVTSHSSNLQDLNQIQSALSEALRGKRFLIVLDDLWNDDYGDWSCLRIPFWGGAKGSKIIVTTRSKGVATMMGGEKNLYELKHLSFEDCWLVFEKHAFENRNISFHPSLVLIGKKIVEKCKGLPLAAKTLGGLLRTKHEEEEWKNILNSKVWNLQGEKSGGIIPALRLSYNNLPSYLKRCFAYCAIFPKNYEFMEKELILLWMAEGLIQCSQDDGKREIEDIGHEYFCELLSMSFFQLSSRNASRFIMHDFIHDLAQLIAGEICFHLEEGSGIDSQCSISEKTLHSSFIRSHFDVFYKFEFFHKVRHLRTFLALPICSSPFLPHYISNKVIYELMLRQATLRVLSLSGYSISEIPDSIGGLKHLRYLNLSNTKIKWLPESICDLYYLQTLILSGCKNLTRLPITIGNLINLRHLDISDTSRLEEMPIQIDKIKCLQVLSNLIVGKTKTLEIKELRNLPHLQGDFCISNLENVMSIQDAKNANLNSKNKLEQLTMRWSAKHDDSRNGMHEMDVLNSLQPPLDLKKLNIMEYGGLKFPSWMGNSLFCKMVDVTLINCRKCMFLPSLGQLPLLKNLWIEGMNELQKGGIEFLGGASLSIKAFPSLESLSFVNMPKWVHWEHNSALASYPHLQQLRIRNCPQLIQTLPSPLPSLVKFSIWKCPQVRIPLPSFPSLCELDLQKCNDMVVRSWTDLTKLTHLTISGISALNRLHEGLMMAFLPALKVLRISECCDLTCLWDQEGVGSESLDHLHRLEIRDCPRLVSLLENSEKQGLLPLISLQYLEIWKCDSLEKLPNGLQSLTCLGELNIWGCAKLESFPDINFPPLLRRLIIRECEGLKSLPDGMMRNSMLEYLEINFCPSLRCFPEGELPTTLKELHISYCENLESLPDGLMMKHDSSSLQVLQIWRCSSLKSFPRGSFPPTLHLLQIWNCRQLESKIEKMFDNDNSLECLEINVNSNIKSIPDCLYKLKRLQIKRCMNLKSLPHQMESLTSLTFLEIADCVNIKTSLSKWGLSRLTSLKSFSIAGLFPEATAFSDDQFLLPSSVTYLSIERFKNLESLASLNLQTLTSLQHLWISGCPKLQSFLPREGLIAATVSQLYIRDCPILSQRCLKEVGEDWPKISHIPYVEIDRKFIFEQ